MFTHMNIQLKYKNPAKTAIFLLSINFDSVSLKNRYQRLQRTCGSHIGKTCSIANQWMTGKFL